MNLYKCNDCGYAWFSLQGTECPKCSKTDVKCLSRTKKEWNGTEKEFPYYPKCIDFKEFLGFLLESAAKWNYAYDIYYRDHYMVAPDYTTDPEDNEWGIAYVLGLGLIAAGVLQYHAQARVISLQDFLMEEYNFEIWLDDYGNEENIRMSVEIQE